MEFYALSNMMTGVGGAESHKSYKYQVEFQTLLQTASIVFFLASQ